MKDKEKEIIKLHHIIRDLEEKNKELEQFVSHATHDIKEPLRSIAIGSEILLKKHQKNLDAEAIKMLEFMLASAKRFEHIIADLKNFTKADSGKLHFENINLNQLLQNVLQNHHILIEATKAKIIIGKLPEINSDAKKLQLVIDHLIQNALKYKGNNTPEVYIDAKVTDTTYIISFKDNGMGIEKAHHERILKPFERLHSKFDIPGSGLGLPLCIKILKRLNGNLWFQSEQERGSTFYIELPKQEPEVG